MYAIQCLAKPRVEHTEFGWLVTDALVSALRNTEGLVVLWGLHTLRNIRYQKHIKKIQTSSLEVMIALETAYMEALPWFSNTQQQGASGLRGTLAKWFWDRQATLMNHKVTYGQRMAQKRQRWAKIGLEVGHRYLCKSRGRTIGRRGSKVKERRRCPRREKQPSHHMLVR